MSGRCVFLTQRAWVAWRVPFHLGPCRLDSGLGGGSDKFTLGVMLVGKLHGHEVCEGAIGIAFVAVVFVQFFPCHT